MKSISYLLAIALLTTCCLFCSKSPFEQSSDLGGPVLAQYDSSLTSAAKNFKSITCKVAVTARQSVVDSATDSVTLAHLAVHTSATTLFAGPWRNDVSAAYLEFGGDSLVKLINDTTHIITGLRFQVKTPAVLPAPPLIIIDILPKKDRSGQLWPRVWGQTFTFNSAFTGDTNLLIDLDAAYLPLFLNRAKSAIIASPRDTTHITIHSAGATPDTAYGAFPLYVRSTSLI
jgi:hypothetical protein